MISLSGRTYQLSKLAPPAMSWSAYSERVSSEWHSLLNSPTGAKESAIQAFLENHPCMVPGSQSMSGTSGHSAFPAALIRQPKLAGYMTRVPDFMWLATDSGTNYAVVIEIESPTKRWFNSDGTQTAKFSQAQNQLTEWRKWFDDPTNRLSFLNYYKFPSLHRRFLPQYVLVYGRSSEFEQAPELAAKRQLLQRDNEYYMSFDRLHPISDASNYMTVECKNDGFSAVSMPATLELGPLHSEYRARIINKEEAVANSPFMSEERKAFLKSRFSYWDDWVKNAQKGIMNTGDRE